MHGRNPNYTISAECGTDLNGKTVKSSEFITLPQNMVKSQKFQIEKSDDCILCIFTSEEGFEEVSESQCNLEGRLCGFTIEKPVEAGVGYPEDVFIKIISESGNYVSYEIAKDDSKKRLKVKRRPF